MTPLKFRGLLLVTAFVSASTLSTRATAAESGEWVVISQGVTDELVKAGKKIGYPGLTAGVAVDRTSGDLFMAICDQGLWKSSDQGRSFARVDGGAVGGRSETGFALNTNPAGQGLAAFMVYGNCGLSSDGGTTWSKWKASHFDVGAVDWADTGKALLTLRHESGGMLTRSTDGGATWTDLGKGYKNGLGMFDAATLVATKGQGILRSADGGQTWQQVSDITPAGATMLCFQGVGYWTSSQGLLVSKDQGRSWNVSGAAQAALHGPYLGKDAQHLVVVAKTGLLETVDGGQSWTPAAPLPPGVAFNSFANFGWDPARNIFYASAMGKPTYRFQR